MPGIVFPCSRLTHLHVSIFFYGIPKLCVIVLYWFHRAAFGGVRLGFGGFSFMVQAF